MGLGVVPGGNSVLIMIFLGVMAAMAAVVGVGPLRELFHFGQVDLRGWALALGGGLGSMLALEALKRSLRTSRRQQPA